MVEDAISAIGHPQRGCDVIDVDDEWMKVSFSDKKGIVTTKIIRIDTIHNIELLD